MQLYQIDIPGGYSGTVEVELGSLKIEFPRATGSVPFKRYNLHLLTPDRRNIEFDLLRCHDGEWYDYEYLQLQPVSTVSSELRRAATVEITRMRI